MLYFEHRSILVSFWSIVELCKTTPSSSNTGLLHNLTGSLNVADLSAFMVLVASVQLSFPSLLTYIFKNLSLSPSQLVFSSESFSCIFVFHRLGRTSGGQLIQLFALSKTAFDVRSGCSGPCVVEFWKFPKMKVLQIHQTVYWMNPRMNRMSPSSRDSFLTK